MGVTVVTAIRDRTEHLTATLPTWCCQDIIDEIVICDFGSEPPLSTDFLKLSPKIKLIVSGAGEPWNLGLALNIAIAASKNDIILKLDCDIFVKNIEKYIPLVASGAFVSGYIPTHNGVANLSKQGCCGQVMFKLRDWKLIGGYHEFLLGWGFDDQDFYNRLEDVGVNHLFFDLNDVRDIPHSDAVRSSSKIVDDLALSIPLELRNNKWFQNTRNKFVAQIAPWEAKFARQRVVRKLSPAHFECVLDARGTFERRTQLVGSFLASRFWLNSSETEKELRRALIDERIAGYTARAIAQGHVLPAGEAVASRIN